jgi:hypothetical protein
MHIHAQIDLIDYQSMLDGQINYVLDYQDHGIKFCIFCGHRHKKLTEQLLLSSSAFSISSDLLPTFKLIMAKSSVMVHQNLTICIWIKQYVIPFVTLSFWTISFVLRNSWHTAPGSVPVLSRKYRSYGQGQCWLL